METSRIQRATGRRRRLASFAVVLALMLAAGAALAAGTSPVLALTSAFAAPGAPGERLVSAAGAFNFDDQVQVAFPAAGLMVVQGSRFVRFEVGGGVIEGTSAAVANGVTASELAALLQEGSPAAPPARVARLLADSVSVVLPSDFAAGPAIALLYARHQDESFVSNAIPVVLP